MSAFQVYPIPSRVADHVRSHGTSPQYGHPAHLELATGTGPCRICLEPFDVGEDERMLFTYNPFEEIGARPLPGPVFIHADQCIRHSGAGFPDRLRTLPLIAEAHRADARSLSWRPLASGSEDLELTALLSDETVQFVHLRHAEAGCYIARVERATTNTEAAT